MKAAAAKAPAQTLGQKFKQRILHGYFVRIHMSLILAAVTASGVLASKGLLMAGIVSLRFRYPVAVLVSYLVFLLLVRIWIWYVCRRREAASGSSGFDLGDLDIPGGWSRGGGSGGGGSVRFGGGNSGGGGASSLWDADAHAAITPPVSAPAPSTSGGSGWGLPDFDLDLGDDGWWIVLLLAVLAVVIVLAGGYLIYAAPQILPEAAWQAVLATTLTRVKKDERCGWIGGVLKATVLPFAIVMILAGALGWVSHKHCPNATKLVEVFSCQAE